MWFTINTDLKDKCYNQRITGIFKCKAAVYSILKRPLYLPVRFMED